MQSLRVMLGGDVMLGRLVGQAIGQYGADYPLGPIAALMRAADLTIINLECAMTDSDQLWSGMRKAFYFAAPSIAIQSLQEAGVDLVNLANNHTLDFDFQGLHDTLAILKQANILYAGAGDNLKQARQPAILNCHGLQFAMISYCDHQADFAASAGQAGRAGMSYLDLSHEKAALMQIEADFKPLQSQGID